MDLTIGRKNTTNIGDFSNIQPNTQFTIKNVNLKDVNLVAALTNSIVDSMDKLQVIECIGDVENLINLKPSIRLYYQTLKENQERIVDNIDESIQEIIDMGYSV